MKKIVAETEAKEQTQKQMELLTAEITRAEQELRQERQARVELEQKLKAETDARLKAEENAQAEAQKRAEIEEELNIQKELTAQANAEAGVQEEANAQARKPLPFNIREIPAPEKTQPCDCCGRNDLALSELHKIDSGHLFCPDCFAALRR